MPSRRSFGFISAAAVILLVTGLLKLTAVPVAGQTASSNAVKTAWGDPDLQGIWNPVYNTPLQRPARFGDREFFTDQERAELDQTRSGLLRRDSRSQTGTEKDVAGAYNAVF